MDGARSLALHGFVRLHPHLHVASAHVGDGGVPLATRAVKQGEGFARLHAQHLHMTGGAGGQGKRLVLRQALGAVDAGHSVVRY